MPGARLTRPSAATPPLVAVVVHPDGAVVSRRGTVEAIGGRIVLRGLPFLLDPGTVRVDAEGIGEVEVDVDAVGLDRAPRPPVLAAIADAERSLARSRAELEGLKAERAWHLRLTPAWTDHPDRVLPTPGVLAAWARLDDRVESHTAELDARIGTLHREVRDADEALAVQRARAAEESGEAAWRHWVPTRVVRARVGVTSGPVEVGVSYVVPGAAWSPAYVLDADPALSRGAFSLRALVIQATGEDWGAVTLRLSTAPVARRVDLPVLRSLRLSARQEPSRPAFRDLPAGFEALFPDLPTPAPEPELSDLLLDEADEAPFDAPTSPTRAPAAPPPAAAPQVQRVSAKSAPVGALGRALSASLDGMFGGGGEAAAAPAVTGARRARDEGHVAPAEPWVDSLDYGRFRLASGDAAPGRRGRLLPGSDADRLAEQGAASALQRFEARAAALRAGSEAVVRAEWPPHHVLAGPIQGNDRVFDVDGRVDLPADGHPHSVAVCRWTTALSVSYRAVPRHDPRAFRIVDARLDGATGPLLPGPVDVLVGGRLELTTPWAGSAGRGQLRIGLGAEDRLRLARNVRYQEESAGLFGGSRRLLTHVEVKVASAIGAPVTIELLERLPVPAERETLTIELTEASPVAEVWKGEPDGPLLAGARAQRLEVPPGGEARAVLAYAVTLGAKDEVVGGDRRG